MSVVRHPFFRFGLGHSIALVGGPRAFVGVSALLVFRIVSVLRRQLVFASFTQFFRSQASFYS